MSLVPKPATVLILLGLIVIAAVVVKTQPEYSQAFLFVQLPFALGCCFLCAAMVRQDASGLAVGAFLWGLATVGLFAIGDIGAALRISFTNW